MSFISIYSFIDTIMASDILDRIILYYIIIMKMLSYQSTAIGVCGLQSPNVLDHVAVVWCPKHENVARLGKIRSSFLPTSKISTK